MASREELEYIKTVKTLLGNIAEEDSGVTMQVALDYGKQLEQAQMPLEEYIPNIPDFVQELKGGGMGDGQIIKYMEKANLSSIQDAMQQRDAQALAEENERRNHAMQQQAMMEYNQNMRMA